MSTAQIAKDAGQATPRQSGARPLEGPAPGVRAGNGRMDSSMWVSVAREAYRSGVSDCMALIAENVSRYGSLTVKDADRMRREVAELLEKMAPRHRMDTD